MLSNNSRLLVYLCALLYGILGAGLYLFPETLAPVFAWKVTAFMTMTIGGWCLGNAWLAFITARRWEWNRVYASLLYLWLFGISELIVLFAFRDKLVLQHPIAWLYLITLITNGVTAIIGIIDYLRIRPEKSLNGELLNRQQKTSVLAFIVFVGVLGIYGLTAQIGDVGTNGGIFPEVMSLFTLRSFGAFYFSLAVSVIPFLWKVGHKTVLHQSVATYGLIIFITIAGFVYLSLFDFTQRPGGLLYFAAYLGVGIPLAFVFRKHGTG
jgi:hypothetical protein